MKKIKNPYYEMSKKFKPEETAKVIVNLYADLLKAETADVCAEIVEDIVFELETVTQIKVYGGDTHLNVYEQEEVDDDLLLAVGYGEEQVEILMEALEENPDKEAYILLTPFGMEFIARIDSPEELDKTLNALQENAFLSKKSILTSSEEEGIKLKKDRPAGNKWLKD